MKSQHGKRQSPLGLVRATGSNLSGLVVAVLVAGGIPLVWIWLASKVAGTKRDLTPSLAILITTGRGLVQVDGRNPEVRFTPDSRPNLDIAASLESVPSTHCPPFERHTSTDQTSTRLIGPRKSILPTLTPLWRRMA